MGVDENIADKQQIETSITQGNNGVRLTITHNLNDRNGDHLTPDEVIAEIISYPRNGGGLNPCNLCCKTRIPSSPEDGTYEIEIRSPEANPGPAAWPIVLKVTSLYHHSIQSDDHTPELTAVAGVQINDCSVPE